MVYNYYESKKIFDVKKLFLAIMAIVPTQTKIIGNGTVACLNPLEQTHQQLDTFE